MYHGTMDKARVSRAWMTSSTRDIYFHTLSRNQTKLGTDHYFLSGVIIFGICRQFFLRKNVFQTIFFSDENNFLMTILKTIKALLCILFRKKKHCLCTHTYGKSHLNANKFTLYKPYAVRCRVSSMVEGIQYRGGLLSVRWRISSTDMSHHQYVGGTSSVRGRVCSMDL